MFLEHIQGPVRANARRMVPYCVRAIEPDWLPFEKSDSKARIVHGVQKDADGMPVAYHFAEELSDPNFWRYASQIKTRTVPAERVEHLKFSRRLKSNPRRFYPARCHQSP